MNSWIDTHCHLDAPEFASDADQMRQRARDAGVVHCVIPAVAAFNFDTVRNLAHRFGDSYALGIHPMCVPNATEQDLQTLDQALANLKGDPRLVAVGEIGLDFFVEELKTEALREKQEHFYYEQLKLAVKHELPVILHVRRSADRLLKYLRQIKKNRGDDPFKLGGIGHAFNGSEQQAQSFIELGFRLGFGGALTFDRALAIRKHAVDLPLSAIVMETDSPDIQPHWLYVNAQDRDAGISQARNEPMQLPRIAEELAHLREISADALCTAVWQNTLEALPKLRSNIG